jgi:hypothetical protein
MISKVLHYIASTRVGCNLLLWQPRLHCVLLLATLRLLVHSGIGQGQDGACGGAAIALVPLLIRRLAAPV